MKLNFLTNLKRTKQEQEHQKGFQDSTEQDKKENEQSPRDNKS